MIKIFWFRKDLRLYDNFALARFIEDLNNIDEPAFIYIKNIDNFDFCGEKRLRFLKNCLFDLDSSLNIYGHKLQILHGTGVSIFRKICNTYSEFEVYANSQVEPYCIQRDTNVKKLLKEKGKLIRFFNDTTIFSPSEILKKDGNTYVVFTHFKNKFFELKNETHISEKKVNLEKLNSFTSKIIIPENSLDIKDFSKQNSGTFFGSRKDSLLRLELFIKKKLNSYNIQRNYPYIDGTSMLSPYIHFGCISIREIFRSLENLNNNKNIETFISELIWREFYYHFTFYHPFIVNESYNIKYRNLIWNDDDNLFRKWCNANTGFPIIDAAMRQLNEEGWMHNRTRMIVASFLTKDLLIHWKKGEKFFAKNLIDLDFCSNNGGWQWCASTGCDAQPYFRIFNPHLQSLKFDPQGKYIRKYLPELKKIPDKYIHRPKLMPYSLQKDINLIIGKDYPDEIVNHDIAKNFAISFFKKHS